jgi:hypothetical protein
MSEFQLSSFSEPDAGEEFSYQDLLDTAAELNVEIQVQEEGEEILEALDPPPAWDISREEVIGNFVMKLETAPSRRDLGITMYFEDDSQAFIVDHEAAFDELVEDMTEKFDPEDVFNDGRTFGEQEENDLPWRFSSRMNLK